ncbi:hypothetical protein AB0K05_24795 [Nonomuraea sp. NPDC049486]|uniref:hypothetical protein n=1 Tax=Nonomuraea sp. NPDC049486 TaxID=3155773 RepID=UPI00341DF3EB
MVWFISAEAELAADIARLDRMTPAELARETAACEAFIAYGQELPGDLKYRAELEKRAHLAHA